MSGALNFGGALAGSDASVMSPGGNVGLGISVPLARFDVNGNFNSHLFMHNEWLVRDGGTTPRGGPRDWMTVFPSMCHSYTQAKTLVRGGNAILTMMCSHGAISTRHI